MALTSFTWDLCPTSGHNPRLQVSSAWGLESLPNVWGRSACLQLSHSHACLTVDLIDPDTQTDFPACHCWTWLGIARPSDPGCPHQTWFWRSFTSDLPCHRKLVWWSGFSAVNPRPALLALLGYCGIGPWLAQPLPCHPCNHAWIWAPCPLGNSLPSLFPEKLYLKVCQ